MSAPVSFYQLALKSPGHNHPISHFCQNCGKIAEKTEQVMNRCQGCFSAFFCNRECQKANWPKHSAFCKDMKPLLAELKTYYFQIKAADPHSRDFIKKMEKLMPIYSKLDQLHLKEFGFRSSFSETLDENIGEKRAYYKITDWFQIMRKISTQG